MSTSYTYRKWAASTTMVVITALPLIVAGCQTINMSTTPTAAPQTAATPATAQRRSQVSVSEALSPQPVRRAENVLMLSRQEITDLTKTTSTEVDASLPEAMRVLMSRAVVDTILNRKACGLFGDTVTAIVNQPWAFSAISSNLPYAYGSVDKMPDSAIKPLVRKDVEAWLRARAAGAPAQESGLNFANPFFSSDRSKREWVNEVKREAEASGHVYGDISRRSVHYHGTAPGLRGKQPQPYTIVLPDGWSLR